MTIPPVSNLHRQIQAATTMTEIMEAADAEMRVNRDAKYADTLPGGNLQIQINPYLNDKEGEDARKWQWMFDFENILAWGEKGSGKGVWGYSTAIKARWWYNKNIIMDTKPYELFDLQFLPRRFDLNLRNPHEPITIKHADYIPFSKQEWLKQLAIMGDASLGLLADEAEPDLVKIEKNKAAEVRRASGVWMSQYGIAMLQNGFLVLDEVKRYHHKLRQNEPFGVMLTDNDDFLRHIHLCRLGMTVYYNDLDPNKYLPKVTVEVHCHKSLASSHVYFADMSKVAWIEAKKTREFKRLETATNDVLAPWPLLGGTIAEITETGKQYIETLKDEPDIEAVNLHKILSYIDVRGGRCAINEVTMKCGVEKPNDVMDALLNFYDPYSAKSLIKLQYAIAHILEDVDMGAFDGKVRLTPYLRLDDTTGFRNLNGVAWLENEYIGYAVRTDKNGYSYDVKGELATLYKDFPSCLIGVQRRLNWRVNHCEPEEHKAGAEIYTGYGIGDTYDSWIPIGVQIPKSMLK